MKTSRFCLLILFLFQFLLVARFVAQTQEKTNSTSTKQIHKDSKQKDNESEENSILRRYAIFVNESDVLVNSLYRDKNFGLVEKFLTKKPKDEEDEFAISRAFSALTSIPGGTTSEEINNMLDVLNNWCNSEPNSYIPFLVRGKFYSALGFRGARDNFSPARQDLEKAAQLNSKDPNTFSALIILAKGLGLGKADVERYYSSAIEASPYHLDARLEKLDYLTPKWYGSDKEKLDFGKSCAEDAKDHPLLGLVLAFAYLDSHKMLALDNHYMNYLANDDVWPKVQEIFENIISNYPNDLRWGLWYSYFSVLAEKHEVALKVFDDVGDRWISNGLWRSLALYNMARAHTYAMLGYKRMLEKDYARSEYHFLNSLWLDPSNPGLYLYLNYDGCQLIKQFGATVLTLHPTPDQRQQAKLYMKTVESCVKFPAPPEPKNPFGYQ